MSTDNAQAHESPAPTGPRPLTGDASNANPRPSQTDRRSVNGPARIVSVVCLPGSGGPHLAAALRRARRTDTVSVRLVVIAEPPSSTPILVGDPLGGAFCLLAPSPQDQQTVLSEARRHAGELWWLVWEMNIDAVTQIRQGNPIDIFSSELLQPGLDTVILAANNTGRWKPTVTALSTQAQQASLPVLVALDSRASRLSRWCQTQRR